MLYIAIDDTDAIALENKISNQSFCQNLHYLHHFCNNNQMGVDLAAQYEVSSPMEVHYANFASQKVFKISNEPPKCLHFLKYNPAWYVWSVFKNSTLALLLQNMANITMYNL